MKAVFARLAVTGAVSLACMTTALAAPVTVGFDNINAQCAYSESGFNFACSGTHTDGNGILYFHNYGANPGLNDVTINFDGGTFSALSFDALAIYDALQIVDNFGRSLFFNAGSSGSYDLSTFTNVTWLKLSTDSNGTGSGVVLDNFKFDNDSANVPEPASLALVGMAIAGLAFARRRNV